MAVFEPDKIVKELIPFVLKIIPNEDDEVLLAISEEISHFKDYLNEKLILATLPLFQSLFSCEETVVRESTIEAMRVLFSSFTEDQVQKEIIPMILSIAANDAFQCKVSACYLIRMSYPKAGKEKEKLRLLYFKFCDDETPIIKKTAAKEFGQLCLVIEKEIVSNEMITYYKKFLNDTDSVIVTILPSLVQLVKLFKNTDLQRTNIQFVVSASENKSWRVRNELAKIFPEFIDYFGNQINELVPTLSNLVKDSETEVKISALISLNKIINKINVDKVQQCIIPSLKSLSNESSSEVKSSIGESFGPISIIVGYKAFNSNLGPMMDALMKDENAEVRLGIAKSMFDIFISSEGSLIPSINNLLGTFQKDSQYRIRESIYDTLARLGSHYGIEAFKGSIEGLFFNYLSDTVSSVREVGITKLTILIEKFGASWITSTLLPKLQSILNTPKLSYLHRMSTLHSLCMCSKYLDPKQNNDLIFPILTKAFKDKIPNVRLYSIKLVQGIFTSFEANCKEKIKAQIKDLTSDEDIDVKYYANVFLSNLK